MIVLVFAFEPFCALSGYPWGWGGVRKVFWGLFIWTANFHFVRFCFPDFFIFGFLEVILSLFWPYRAIFGVGVGSKMFVGV